MGNECDNVNTEESMTNNFEANLVGDIGRLRHTSTPIRTLNSMFEVKGVFCCISITQHWETFFQIMAP